MVCPKRQQFELEHISLVNDLLLQNTLDVVQDLLSAVEFHFASINSAVAVFRSEVLLPDLVLQVGMVNLVSTEGALRLWLLAKGLIAAQLLLFVLQHLVGGLDGLLQLGSEQLAFAL